MSACFSVDSCPCLFFPVICSVLSFVLAAVISKPQVNFCGAFCSFEKSEALNCSDDHSAVTLFHPYRWLMSGATCAVLASLECGALRSGMLVGNKTNQVLWVRSSSGKGASLNPRRHGYS